MKDWGVMRKVTRLKRRAGYLWALLDCGHERAVLSECDEARCGECKPPQQTEPTEPCPECAYELEHGQVGPYAEHTCDRRKKKR
jgi:hypothetical protein